jgi:hypothetical protein
VLESNYHVIELAGKSHEKEGKWLACRLGAQFKINHLANKSFRVGILQGNWAFSSGIIK